jgi:hypothetical protein
MDEAVKPLRGVLTFRVTMLSQPIVAVVQHNEHQFVLIAQSR